MLNAKASCAVRFLCTASPLCWRLGTSASTWRLSRNSAGRPFGALSVRPTTTMPDAAGRGELDTSFLDAVRSNVVTLAGANCILQQLIRPSPSEAEADGKPAGPDEMIKAGLEKLDDLNSDQRAYVVFSIAKDAAIQARFEEYVPGVLYCNITDLMQSSAGRFKDTIDGVAQWTKANAATERQNPRGHALATAQHFAKLFEELPLQDKLYLQRTDPPCIELSQQLYKVLYKELPELREMHKHFQSDGDSAAASSAAQAAVPGADRSTSTCPHLHLHLTL